ncbi:glycosyltransferase family 2 protein [Mariprofundus ferrooxydans]|nr:glycosyltransferase family 2 protein [Mariprofundus ferrooxydans]
MATFNGDAFLKQQLDSICMQDGSWHLIIRDDGSTDLTAEILSSYKRIHGNISVITDQFGNQGACCNFNKLLIEAEKVTSNQYFLLADQDDVWEWDKLKKQLTLMKCMEKKHPDQAILIHSDLAVVDQDLNTIDLSMMRYQGIQHEPLKPLNVLLTHNFVTGCTILMNRRLLEFALPMPADALMHDWWLALCAAVFGHIGYIDQPLVKYRQHDRNEVGAKHVNEFLNPLSKVFQKRWVEGKINLFKSMKQAQVLAERIREHDPENQHLALVEEYASLQYLSPMQRLFRLQKLGVHAQSSIRQALLLSRLFFASRVRDV